MDKNAAPKSEIEKQDALFYGVAQDRYNLLVHPDFLGPDPKDDLNTIDAYNHNLGLGISSSDFEPYEFRKLINSIKTMSPDDVPGVLELVSVKKDIEELLCSHIAEIKEIKEALHKVEPKDLKAFLPKTDDTEITDSPYGISEKEQLCLHLDNELHTLDTHIINLESKINRLKAWFSFLQINVDYIDIRKIINEARLNPEGSSTTNKLTKNIDLAMAIDQNVIKNELYDVLKYWAKGDPVSPKNPSPFKAWVHHAFFRKVSKLGIQFASEHGLNIHWNVSFGAKANVSLDDAVAEKKSKEKKRSPISASELRYYLRNRKVLSNKNSFWNLPINYYKNVPKAEPVAKIKIRRAANEYNTLKRKANRKKYGRTL